MTQIAPHPEHAAEGGIERFVFQNASWDFYLSTSQQLHESGRRARITYYRGRMELMTLSRRHEHIKTLTARLVESYGLLRRVPITGLGSCTCQEQGLELGIEPDECFYVATPPPPPDVEVLDLSVFPPPDLAIEVDVTRSSVPRQPIYAAMGVPELWRWTGQRLAILILDGSGSYQPSDRSRAFPDLTESELNRLIQIGLTTSQHEAVMALEAWLRDNP